MKKTPIIILFIILLFLFSLFLIFQSDITNIIGHSIFDAKVTQSITSLTIRIIDIENNVTVPASGNVSFSNPNINNLVPKISCLVPGWLINFSLYGNNYPNDWEESEPTEDEAETKFKYFEIKSSNSTEDSSCPYRVYFNLSQGTIGNISPDDIRLFMYEGGWTELTTVIINSTSDPAQFYGIPPHFSKFFIGEIPAIHTEDPSPPGGGGGSRTTIVENITETPLFDVRVSIPRKYTAICCGEEGCEGGELIAEINIVDVNRVGIIDISIGYIIKDSWGNVKFRKTETKAIDGELHYIKELKYPCMEVGQYILEVEIRYNDEFASGSYPFRIIEEGGLEDQARKLVESEKGFIITAGIIITLIIISIVITLSGHKRMEHIEKHIKRKGTKLKERKKKQKR